MIGPSEDTIPEITRAMAKALAAVPVEIFYGRQRFSRQIVTGNKIQVEQVGPETFGPSMGTASTTDPSVGSRTIAVQILVDAKSDQRGADENDHRRLANWLTELAWAFFLEEAQLRCEPVENWLASGGFTELPDGDLEVGARYVLSFSVGRSVKRFEDMLSADLGALGITAAGTTRVHAGNATEIACGE